MYEDGISDSVNKPMFEWLEPRVLLSGTPELVLDIGDYPSSSQPRSFVDFDGMLFFTADDHLHGEELWKSDGTEAGTVMVKDINPGLGDGTSNYSTPISVNGTLFFVADDGVHGKELWKSDGTEAGTVMVRDINPGPSNSQPTKLINFNGKLFFTASDGVHGTELWKSDGTEAGTVLVKDIDEEYGSAPENLTVVNDRLFFSLPPSLWATEKDSLWATDGTEAGTVMIKDFGPTMRARSQISHLADVGGTLFCFVSDDVYHIELWKSDGTEVGTVLVKYFDSGSRHSGRYPDFDMADVNGTLFFTAYDVVDRVGLWKSDGTAEGTVLVTGFISFPTHLANANGMLFFYAKDAVNGYSYWRSDGTEAGTVIVEGDGSAILNGTRYYMADDGVHGYELWKNDGTPEGTMMVKDIRPGSYGSRPKDMFFVDGTLFFIADEGIHGNELWKSDGTEEGTVLIKDIGLGTWGSSLHDLTDVDGTLFFAAGDNLHGRELWKSDGTATGTVLVKDIKPGSSSSSTHDNYLTNVNGTLFFTADDGVHGKELWKSDGTEAGTVMVRDIRPGESGSDMRKLTNVNGTLFFTADDGVHGTELWKSDGTETGTMLTKDVLPGTGDGVDWRDPWLTTVGETLFFVGNDGVHGPELWKSDGTEAGTVMVSDIVPGEEGSDPEYLVNVDGTLFLFSKYDRLWKSDGTEAGTVMVTEAYLRLRGYEPDPWEVIDGTLFFQGNGELWRTDGTEVGTVRVKNIAPGGRSSNPRNLTNFNGKLLFMADDDVHGYEFWISDGTEEGTVLLKDIYPGPRDFWTWEEIVVIGDTAFFVDDGSVNGTDLWKTDGTEAGTVMIKAGMGGGWPMYPTVSSGTLFFAAEDSSFNEELWKLSNDQPPVVEAGEDQTADEGQAVQIAASFTDADGNTVHTAEIDWGDGTVTSGLVDESTGTVTADHSYADDGEYAVTVTVTDEDDQSGSDEMIVTVNNVAPTVEMVSTAENLYKYKEFSLLANFSDPSPVDTFTVTINWGDGTVETGVIDIIGGTVGGSHAYTTEGTYSVTVTVLDDDGGIGSATMAVTVLSTREAVGDLLGSVLDLDLGNPVEKSLVGKLSAMSGLLTKGKSSKRSLTVLLEAFIRQVEHWQDKGRIDDSSSEDMIASAGLILQDVLTDE